MQSTDTARDITRILGRYAHAQTLERFTQAEAAGLSKFLDTHSALHPCHLSKLRTAIPSPITTNVNAYAGSLSAETQPFGLR